MLGCPHGTWCQFFQHQINGEYHFTPVWCQFRHIACKIQAMLAIQASLACFMQCSGKACQKVMPEWHKNEFGLFQFVSGMLGCPHGTWCQFFQHRINGEYHFYHFTPVYYHIACKSDVQARPVKKWCHQFGDIKMNLASKFFFTPVWGHYQATHPYTSLVSLFRPVWSVPISCLQSIRVIPNED